LSGTGRNARRAPGWYATPPSPGTSFLTESDGETDTLMHGTGLTETLADGTTGMSTVVEVGTGSGSSSLQAAIENEAAAIRARAIGSFFTHYPIGKISGRPCSLDATVT
jgi:hypothetical protein